MNRKVHSDLEGGERISTSMTTKSGFHDDHTKLHFVLIHGAGHGAWCWYKLVHLLQNSGHQVTAIDLAGAGINTVNPNSITSFEDYNAPLMNMLYQILPNSQKVVLVGHSAGGLSLSHAIHVFGHKIAVAVYVAATMLPHGFSSEQDYQMGVPEFLKVSEYYHGLGLHILQKEIQLSPPEDVALASLLIRPIPFLALHKAQFHETSEEVIKVPRVYIKTLKDKLLLLEQQEAMIKTWPPDEVISMDTDHCPFFSLPLDIHEHLLHIANLFSK